jgi:uncharacterized protein HemX
MNKTVKQLLSITAAAILGGVAYYGGHQAVEKEITRSQTQVDHLKQEVIAEHEQQVAQNLAASQEITDQQINEAVADKIDFQANAMGMFAGLGFGLPILLLARRKSKESEVSL